MSGEVFTILADTYREPLMLLADAYDQAALNGTAKRIRRGVVTSTDLIALSAIEAALATPATSA